MNMLPASTDVPSIGQAFRMEALLADLRTPASARHSISTATAGRTTWQGPGRSGWTTSVPISRHATAADVVALGEAAGYQGMRWSGIAFTSERDLARWGRPVSAHLDRSSQRLERAVRHDRAPRAGRARRGASRDRLEHGADPSPQARRSRSRTGARPSGEIEAGAVYAERLLELVKPQVIVAVGRVAEQILGSRATYVRHPANGGATAFAEGMRSILT